jgi:hypothetical protein
VALFIKNVFLRPTHQHNYKSGIGCGFTTALSLQQFEPLTCLRSANLLTCPSWPLAISSCFREWNRSYVSFQGRPWNSGTIADRSTCDPPQKISGASSSHRSDRPVAWTLEGAALKTEQWTMAHAYTVVRYWLSPGYAPYCAQCCNMFQGGRQHRKYWMNEWMECVFTYVRMYICMHVFMYFVFLFYSMLHYMPHVIKLYNIINNNYNYNI